jgi:hypothetical protein
MINRLANTNNSGDGRWQFKRRGKKAASMTQVMFRSNDLRQGVAEIS